MSQLGLGVMIKFLGGNEETVNAIKSSIGKKIKKVWLDEGENRLKFEFEDDSILEMYDDGQSCCEHRFMRTDDNLDEYAGATLLNFELKDVDIKEDDEWGEVQEIQFLDVITD